MGILQLIASRNFITVNKDLIKLLGLDEAILLGELASEFDYWEKQDKLEDGFFYSTIENIETNTTLSEFKQRKALNNLKQLKLVEVKVKGIPAKRFIKINEVQLLELLKDKFLKNSGTGTEIIKELDTKKLKGNNNINNKNNNKNKYIYYGEYQNVFFTDEQYKKLIDEFPNDYNIRIEKLDFYIQSTGKKYKDCLATIRNWARNEKGQKKGNNNGTIKRSDGSEFAEFS